MNVTDRYDSLFRWYGEKRAVAPRLLKAQGLAESNLNPEALSPAGAMGLMQFMPATWEDAKRFTPLPRGADRRNPEQSIAAAAAYMRWLLAAWDGDVLKALSSYNWGIGRMRRQVAKGGNWMVGIPSETSKYIERIIRYRDSIVTEV